MEYKGKLYGRIAGLYFEIGKTADDFDALLKRIDELEVENKELRHLLQGVCLTNERLRLNQKTTLVIQPQTYDNIDFLVSVQKAIEALEVKEEKH